MEQGQPNYILRSYMATGLQTYIYKSIIGTTVCIYRSEGLVVREVREMKGQFKVPHSSLVGFGTVSTGKSDFPQENTACNYSVEQLKKNGFSFTKIGNFCLLY